MYTEESGFLSFGLPYLSTYIVLGGEDSLIQVLIQNEYFSVIEKKGIVLLVVNITPFY